MSNAPDALVAERKAILTEIRDLSESVEKAGREFTDDEVATIEDRMGKARDLTDKITKARVASALSEQVKSFLDAAGAEELNADALAGASKGMPGRRTKSLGEYFTDHENFKSALKRYPGGAVPMTSQFSLAAPVPIDGGLKALVGTDPRGDESGAGNLWDPQRLPTVQATWPELKLRNVITVGQTGSDSIFFARVLRAGTTGTVNNAAGVREATSAEPIGSGDPAVTPVQAGLKPQSALEFEKVTAPVVTIAHWIPATKKALSDAGQLRTLIDNFLRQGLQQEIERQIIDGDSSVGEEFDGLLQTDGIQVQNFDTNVLVSIRKALTKVSRFGTANAVLVSPGTAERIDLLRTATGNYLGGGAFGPANPTVWRKPIIEIPGLSDSTVLVGDFSTAVLWDREEANITATDSHADFFTRNLVAILAEARAAFGVLDPALIARVNVTGEDEIVPPTPAAA